VKHNLGELNELVRSLCLLFFITTVFTGACSPFSSHMFFSLTLELDLLFSFIRIRFSTNFPCAALHGSVFCSADISPAFLHDPTDGF
jgi:hypothetical protein